MKEHGNYNHFSLQYFFHQNLMVSKNTVYFEIVSYFSYFNKSDVTGK
jgi:hypothetical protein